MNNPNIVQEITPLELARRMASDRPALLLDVRQPWEHDAVAIAGSTLIPISEFPARAAEITVAKDALVVIYCHHGLRSISAALVLQQLGFQNVFSLSGGIDAWSVFVDPTLPRY